MKKHLCVVKTQQTNNSEERFYIFDYTVFEVTNQNTLASFPDFLRTILSYYKTRYIRCYLLFGHISHFVFTAAAKSSRFKAHVSSTSDALKYKQSSAD